MGTRKTSLSPESRRDHRPVLLYAVCKPALTILLPTNFDVAIRSTHGHTNGRAAATALFLWRSCRLCKCLMPQSRPRSTTAVAMRLVLLGHILPAWSLHLGGDLCKSNTMGSCQVADRLAIALIDTHVNSRATGEPQSLKQAPHGGIRSASPSTYTSG